MEFAIIQKLAEMAMQLTVIDLPTPACPGISNIRGREKRRNLMFAGAVCPRKHQISPVTPSVYAVQCTCVFEYFHKL